MLTKENVHDPKVWAALDKLPDKQQLDIVKGFIDSHGEGEGNPLNTKAVSNWIEAHTDVIHKYL